ncbi:16523_t:CDS:2, partial [Entrophospora sp. SA101]
NELITQLEKTQCHLNREYGNELIIDDLGNVQHDNCIEHCLNFAFDNNSLFSDNNALFLNNNSLFSDNNALFLNNNSLFSDNNGFDEQDNYESCFVDKHNYCHRHFDKYLQSFDELYYEPYFGERNYYYDKFLQGFDEQDNYESYFVDKHNYCHRHFDKCLLGFDKLYYEPYFGERNYYYDKFLHGFGFDE